MNITKTRRNPSVPKPEDLYEKAIEDLSPTTQGAFRFMRTDLTKVFAAKNLGPAYEENFARMLYEELTTLASHEIWQMNAGMSLAQTVEILRAMYWAYQQGWQARSDWDESQGFYG